MPYDWEFSTEGRLPGPLGKRCHRGPMLDIEVVMSQPFTAVEGAESLRARLLAHLVNTNLWAVRTREAILRVLDCNLGPIFVALNNKKTTLRVDICEKRNSVPVDQELLAWDADYIALAKALKDHDINAQNIDAMIAALEGLNPVFRVAARCAIILMAAYVEQRSP